MDLEAREIRVRGKGGRQRTVKISHEAARRLDRYLRARSRHRAGVAARAVAGGRATAGRWTAAGSTSWWCGGARSAGCVLYPHRFRHHFCQTWLDRGGAEGDLMELSGWSTPQMLTRYGGTARGARARRSYDRVMSS